ncbi:MAG: hypothetical protein LBV77_02390 [Candidatus Adiutrix intracellularis]|jgi:hypothetical protein|nr:hypothetical protein [Candidatus Adiutrix intracellularis]
MDQDKKPDPFQSLSIDKSCSDCKDRHCYCQDKLALNFRLSETKVNAEGVVVT